jgi:hypothetical protein
MDSLTNKKNIPKIILGILFVAFIVMDYKLPQNVAEKIDTLWGKILVVVIALSLFAYSSVLGVLGLIAGYHLIKSSGEQTGMSALREFYPTQEKVWSPFTPAHQFKYTLEEELVKKMTTANFNTEYVRAPFAPKLDDTHNAKYLQG